MNFKEQLTVDLWILDAMLTGGDSRSGRGAGGHNHLVNEGWLIGSDVFYLSDGGYSRVGCGGTEMKRLFLTSNSTDRVKERWESSKLDSIKRRIECLVERYYSTDGKCWQE